MVKVECTHSKLILEHTPYSLKFKEYDCIYVENKQKVGRGNDQNKIEESGRNYGELACRLSEPEWLCG